MPWPLSQDYNEAVQDPAVVFADPELKAGEAVANALGVPMPRSGNFADVYEFNCPAKNAKYAIKCFTRQVPGLQERYHEISSHLAQAKLPFMVDFQYQPQGIRIRGDWYPILKMQWVEGLLLNQFVRDNLDKTNLIDVLSKIWVRMGKRLREAKVAHADLQHGNVILVPGAKANVLSVRLIDYDGMFVPTLADKKSGEVGHPAFQHPERLKTGAYNGTVDRFALLLVATALRALQISGRKLWEPYDTGDNLLFRQADLAEPVKSKLFGELWNTNDAALHDLTGWLYLAATSPLQGAPDLDLLVNEAGQVKPLSAEQETQVKTALGPGAAVTRKAAPAPSPPSSTPIPKVAAKETRNDLADLEPAPARPQRAAAAKKLPMGWILGGAGVGVGLLVLILVLALGGGGGGPDDKKQAKIDPNKDKKVQKDKKIDLDKKIVTDKKIDDKKIDDKKDPIVLDPPDKKEFKPLPMPNVIYVKNEEAPNGKYTIHTFRVVNFNDFGPELFVMDPTLGPFGKNPNAPRTIVEIYAADGKLLYENGSAIAPRSLENLWLNVEKGAVPPDAVYVVLNDRKTKEQMRSNLVKIEGGAAAPPPAVVSIWDWEDKGTISKEDGKILKDPTVPGGIQGYSGKFLKVPLKAGKWHVVEAMVPANGGGLVIYDDFPKKMRTASNVLDPRAPILLMVKPEEPRAYDVNIAMRRPPKQDPYALKVREFHYGSGWHWDKDVPQQGTSFLPYSFEPGTVYLLEATSKTIRPELRIEDKASVVLARSSAQTSSQGVTHVLAFRTEAKEELKIVFVAPALGGDVRLTMFKESPPKATPKSESKSSSRPLVSHHKGTIDPKDGRTVGKDFFPGKFLKVPLQADKWYLFDLTSRGIAVGLSVFLKHPDGPLVNTDPGDPRQSLLVAARPVRTQEYDVCITPSERAPVEYELKVYEFIQADHSAKDLPVNGELAMKVYAHTTYLFQAVSKQFVPQLKLLNKDGAVLAAAPPGALLAFRPETDHHCRIVVAGKEGSGTCQLAVRKEKTPLLTPGPNIPQSTGGTNPTETTAPVPQRDYPGIDYWANTWTALVRGHPEIVHLGKHNPKDIFLTPPRNGHSEVHFPLQPLKEKVVGLRGGVTIADNTMPSKSALKFSMQTTDGQAWYSKPIAKNGEVQMFDVPLTNPSHLNLIVECPGDMGNAWSLWLAPRVVLEGGKEIFLADVPVQRVQGSSSVNKAALDLIHFMPDSPQTFGKKFTNACWQIMAPRGGLGRIGLPVAAEARYFQSGYGVPDMADSKSRELHFALLERLDTTRFNNQKYKILWLSSGKHVPGQLDHVITSIPKGMNNLQLAVISRQQDGQSVSFVAPRFLTNLDGVPEALVRKSGPAALASRKMSEVISFDKVGWYKDSGKSLPFFNQLPWCQVESANVLAMPAPSGASFAVGKTYARFTGFMANAQRGKITGGELFFRVLGDGKQIWKSPALNQTEQVYFEVPIAGVDSLRLETQVVGMVGNHQPVWVEPSLYVD